MQKPEIAQMLGNTCCLNIIDSTSYTVKLQPFQKQWMGSCILVILKHFEFTWKFISMCKYL